MSAASRAMTPCAILHAPPAKRHEKDANPQQLKPPHRRLFYLHFYEFSAIITWQIEKEPRWLVIWGCIGFDKDTSKACESGAIPLLSQKILAAKNATKIPAFA